MCIESFSDRKVTYSVQNEWVTNGSVMFNEGLYNKIMVC